MADRVVIIGAGHVGSHVAMSLSSGQVCDEIVLVDKVPGKAEAQAADIADAMISAGGSRASVRAGAYADCAGAAVTVCAVGQARRPGQTRLDLLGDSVLMVRDLARSLRETPPGGIVISITNPCDIIADLLRRELGMDRFRCFGTGTLLDTARLNRILCGQTGALPNEVEAYVLGEHGDSSMIPCGALRVRGVPALSLPSFDPLDALRRTRGTGMDIIEGKGCTEFGIGQAAARLIRAVLTDSGEVLPLSVLLNGEYGVSGVPCGVPCRVGREGIRGIVTLPLVADERAAFENSVSVLETYAAMARQA